MSRIAPQVHEPVVPEKRRAFRAADMRQRLLDQNGRCAHCRAALLVFHGDHILPRELDGRTDYENLQLLCGPCHAIKTVSDIKMIAKARRLRKKNADPETRAFEKPKRPIHNKGFDPSRTRGLNGKVRMK